MATLGWLLYVMLAVLLYYFWTKVRGYSYDDLLERATHEHHQVHAVLAKHPRGGSWAEYKRWLANETEGCGIRA